MDEAETRVFGAKAVGERWRQMGIHFLVLHGLEGYPDRIGRDLDTLMDQSLADTALSAAASTLGSLGWRSVFPPDTWGKRLVALRSNGKAEFDYLEFHTMGSVRWMVLPLVESSERESHAVGPFPANHWATFMKALVSPLLAGDHSRLTPDYIESHVRSGVRPEAIDTRCRTYFGSELGGALIQGLANRDPDRLIGSAAPLRRLLFGRMLQQPVVSLRETPAFLRRRAPNPFSSSGLHVILETPGTPEMEAVVDSLVGKLASVFVEIDVRNRKSKRRTSRERLRSQGRQALAIDHIDDLPPDGWRLGASTRELGTHAKSVEFDLHAHDVSSVSADLAEWIVSTWTEKLSR